MGFGMESFITFIVQIVTMRLGDGLEESRWLSHIFMAGCVLGVWMVCVWYGLVDFAKHYQVRRGDGGRHRAREVAFLIGVVGLCLGLIQMVRVMRSDTITINGWLLRHQILQMVLGGILASIYIGAFQRRWLYTMDSLKDLKRSLCETPTIPVYTRPNISKPQSGPSKPQSGPMVVQQSHTSPPPSEPLLTPSATFPQPKHRQSGNLPTTEAPPIKQPFPASSSGDEQRSRSKYI